MYNIGKEISLEERKKIQLDMLLEIHDFCVSHRIKYSLAYGTLIGAIRHKGYIPWDDDVDIMMPMPDMLRFKEEFHSKKIKYCDIDTEKHFEYAFSRLAYKDTYNKTGLSFKSYGVNIDLYPVFNVPDSIEERDVYFERGCKYLENRLNYIRWRKRVICRFPVSTIPGFDKSIRKYRDYMMFNGIPYGSTHHYFIFGGSLDKNEREKCTYDFDLFSGLIDVDFEGTKLSSIERYHDFLTYYYGDYMQLPPESERHPYHGGHYFWQEK